MKALRSSILLALACLVFTTGCVFRRLAFKQADLLIQFEINSAVGLEDAQKNFLDRELDLFLRGLNRIEVPQLQNLLVDVVRRVDTGISKKEIESLYSRWEDIYEGAVRRASGPTAEFLHSLSDAQVEKWRNYQERKIQKKIQELNEGESKYIHEREKKMRSNFLKWIGGVNADQKSAIAEFIRADWLRVRLEANVIAQSQLLVRQAIMDRKGHTQLQNLLLSQTTRPFTGLSQAHITLKSSRRDAWINLLSSVAATLTMEQKAILKDEVKKLSSDLALLGSQP